MIKRKPGRKPLPKSEKHVRIVLYLLPIPAADLQARADKAGERVGKYVAKKLKLKEKE